MLVKIGGAQLSLDDSGAGEPVVLLHAAASSGVQWAKIKNDLNRNFRILIPDLLGEGRTPGLADWSDLLEKELRLIRALIESTGDPVHVVGHSYGGVIAMELARRYPHLFSSLILIEPVAFQLLKTYPRNENYNHLLAVKDACGSALESGDALSAAYIFVSYWSGPEAWQQLSHGVQNALAKGMEKVVKGWNLIFSDPGQLSDFHKIMTSTLVMAGDRSPLPIQWLAHQLAAAIPAAIFIQIKSAGHMSPVTHANEISVLIRRHIEQALSRRQIPVQDQQSLWSRPTSGIPEHLNAERGTWNVERGME